MQALKKTPQAHREKTGEGGHASQLGIGLRLNYTTVKVPHSRYFAVAVQVINFLFWTAPLWFALLALATYENPSWAASHHSLAICRLLLCACGLHAALGFVEEEKVTVAITVE